MIRVIGISSGKGGVGKTTVVANLALALKNLGKRVLIIDCNLSTPHLSYYLGVNNYRSTLNDVMLDRAKLESAIYNYEGIKFIPASLDMEDLIGLDLRKFKRTVMQLSDPSSLDFILLDSAPGLGREAVCVLNAADEILFVSNPFVPMINDVMRCLSVIKQIGRKKVGIVLNMVTGNGYELLGKVVENVTKVPVVGTIAFDKNMYYSLVSGEPILEYNPCSHASVGFMELAANLTGEVYSPPGKMERIAALIKNKISDFRSAHSKIPQTKDFVERELILQEGQDKELKKTKG